MPNLGDETMQEMQLRHKAEKLALRLQHNEELCRCPEYQAKAQEREAERLARQSDPVLIDAREQRRALRQESRAARMEMQRAMVTPAPEAEPLVAESPVEQV